MTMKLWDSPALVRARRPYASFVYFSVYMRLLCKYVSFYEKYVSSKGVVNLPPPSLRYKVLNSPEASVFLSTGKRNSEAITDTLKKASLDIDSFENVLDFGCGCGRTLRWFSNLKPKFYGTDVDPQAIEWCKNNLKFASFDTNGSLPPLKYDDRMFDFIYVLSVFTHIDEDFQFKWINELNRVLKEGGIILVTFHGVGSYSDLLPEELNDLKKKGFVYRITNDKKGLLPRWYQTSHHTKEYVIKIFSNSFKLLTYDEEALKHSTNFQDVAIFQKYRC
jgi:ubiquinone/menaquinone biosynthesis C-methylase UbiE